MGNASAHSCVLLLNISGGEVGGRSVYSAHKILCTTLRGPGSEPRDNSSHPLYSWSLSFQFSNGKLSRVRKWNLMAACCRPCGPPGRPLPQVAPLVHEGASDARCRFSTELLVPKGQADQFQILPPHRLLGATSLPSAHGVLLQTFWGLRAHRQRGAAFYLSKHSVSPKVSRPVSER